MTYILPELPYSTHSLEPFYDKATLEIHHRKHHAGYVTKLNETMRSYPEMADKSVEELLSNLYSLPAEIRVSVAHNGGGHANHSLFWRTMEPKNDRNTFGALAEAIPASFGTFKNFKEKFTQLSVEFFGSGWTWLSVGLKGQMLLSNTQNQESPLSRGVQPILGLDLWEHAYYLKFQNRRIDWIESWWNLVNWREVSDLYARIVAGATLQEVYADEHQMVKHV